MPDNDPVLNCASGACCRLGSPEQIGALAQVIEGVVVEGVAANADHVPCHRIAKRLTELGLIGLPIAGAAFARWVQWSLAPSAGDTLGGAASPNAGPEGA